jgi:hypothetical protein
VETSPSPLGTASGTSAGTACTLDRPHPSGQHTCSKSYVSEHASSNPTAYPTIQSWEERTSTIGHLRRVLLHVASNVGAVRFDPILSSVKPEPLKATMFDGNVQFQSATCTRAIGCFLQPIEGTSTEPQIARPFGPFALSTAQTADWPN